MKFPKEIVSTGKLRNDNILYFSQQIPCFASVSFKISNQSEKSARLLKRACHPEALAMELYQCFIDRAYAKGTCSYIRMG